MTGKQLKNSILQMAIQGKLVPQIATEESASELLKKIRKEKEQLVKEGKLKKKDLEVTPITDDEKPFEIPDSWEWVRWGDLSFSIQYGYNASAQVNGDIRMVRISDIQDNEVMWDTVPYCTIKSNEIESYLLEENDILFARTGGTVGKSFLVGKVPYPAIYAGYLIRTRYSNELVPKYLKMFMESSIYWDQLRDGTIATAQPNCNGKTLSKMVLPLPPLAEQKRIVERIEQLMPMVEEYGKAQGRLNALNESLPDALKKSILQEAISGKLVPQIASEESASELLKRIHKEKEQLIKEGKLKKKDLETTPITEDEKPFEIPDSWEWVRLKQICPEFIVPQRDKPTKFGGQIPWCRIEDIEGKYLNGSKSNQLVTKELADKMNMHICPKGTVICACSASIGNQAITTVDCYTNQTFIGIVCNNLALFNEYLYYFLMSQKKELKELGKGTTISYISRKKFEDYSFPLPPLSEQKRIVQKIEELFEKIDCISK